ncbi:MAG: adenylyl-sulfate kinase [Candidatus Thorarchaeota archaeon]
MNKDLNGFCVWLTGLSGSGKTTLALLLENELRQRGMQVEVLDEDTTRLTKRKGIVYSFKDRKVNLLEISLYVNSLIHDGIGVIVESTTPYQSVRGKNRKQISDIVEVFVEAPLEVCARRDPKGLYAQALAGRKTNFTELNILNEPPRSPDIIVPTHQESPKESLVRIVKGLEILGRIPVNSSGQVSPEETKLIEKHLRDLGYL